MVSDFCHYKADKGLKYYLKKDRHISFYSKGLDRKIFVSQLLNLTFAEQSFLLTESQCVLEDLEYYLNETRSSESDDAAWESKLSSKITFIRRFVRVCQMLVGENRVDEKYNIALREVEKANICLKKIAEILDKNTPFHIELFLQAREAVRETFSTKKCCTTKVRYFDDLLLNSKDAEKVTTAVRLCELGQKDSLKHLARKLHCNLNASVALDPNAPN